MRAVLFGILGVVGFGVFAYWRAYRRVRAADAATAGSRFIRHERFGDTLARSTFDNGVQILVNYGDAPQTVDGMGIASAKITGTVRQNQNVAAWISAH